jgi:hypothetical protein
MRHENRSGARKSPHQRALPGVDPPQLQGKKAVRYTREETKLQEEFVHKALAAGSIDYAIVKAMDKPGIPGDPNAIYTGPRAGRGRVRTLITRVLDSWKREDEVKKSSWRATAVRQLERDMRDLRTNKNIKSGAKHSLLLRYHSLRGDLQGTKSFDLNVNLNVTISQAVIGVIAEMSPEQVEQALGRYKENIELANEARQLGMGEREGKKTG